MILATRFFYAALAMALPFWGSLEAVAAPDIHPCIYFSPEDHLADHLVSLIHRENKQIRVAVYAFTHRGIAKALADAKGRGVDVEGIVDPFSLKRQHSVIDIIAKGGAHVWVWNPSPNLKSGSEKTSPKRRNSPLMHDKFCVFGNQMVWTGSFNFTYEADSRNEENGVLLEDKEISNRFLEKFEKIRSQSTSYQEYSKRLLK